ncbi:MAG: NTP transferase domain-containing protein [Bacilli bacterium]|nr:NTP transferase domain-containing protein [Bacilli bacterium]
MQVVILAGGEGIHLPGSGITTAKGMVNVGNQPILCHIMDQFSAYGLNDFVICAGKHQMEIKQFFLDYYVRNNDILVDLGSNTATIETNRKKQWRVRVVDTGVNVATGGRLKRVASYLNPKEPCLVAYADTLADVDIKSLIEQHISSGKKATITTYNASQKFGVVETKPDGTVTQFRSRNAQSLSLINIGFMVLDPSVLDLINGDDIVLEKYPLEELARQGQLGAYVHEGFYSKLDTLNDKVMLDNLFATGQIKFGA